MKKAVFFDIDGTLWDRENRIPGSAAEGIRQLRKNGHLAFLNSGRSRAYIQDPKLLAIGFDGIVSACGTMIELGGETVFYHRIDDELALRTVRTVRRFGFRPILEGRDYIYFDDREFGSDPYGQKIKRELGDRLKGIEEEWGRWEISKLACATEEADTGGCMAALKDEFDFLIHNAAVLEMVPKGFHKGTGIEMVCRLTGVPLENTVAFGDSANDVDMLKTAGMAVVMGNGQESAKKAAGYVTAALHQDGIWKALKALDLI